MKMSATNQWTCKRCGWINPSYSSKRVEKCISCSKLRPKEKKPSPDLATVANKCVVLGLDTANHCGWALRDRGTLIEYGEHALFSKSGVERTQYVILRALKMAYEQEPDLTLMVVSERPWGGRMGLGDTKAYGYWLHALLIVGLSMKQIMQVYPSQWRSKILPSGSASLERDDVREIEKQKVLELTGRNDIGSDACAAILISLWGSYSTEVFNSL